MAGGEALPDVVCEGTGQNWPGRFGRERHFYDMERKAASPSFFTERTLASYLAVSDRTVRNWIRRGELPSYKLGAARRIDPADVEDFLSRHRDEAS
jgi:excisionase family DNA binding protein